MKTAVCGFGFCLLGLSLGAAPAFAAAELHTVASFSVLADVVQQVGGARVEVRSLVPPNGDPHEFEPSPGDAQALKQADLVFVSGFGLEGWMERLISASGYRGQPVNASTGIVPRQLEEDGRLGDDPHVWNSVRNVEVWVDNIEQALEAADPQGAAQYQANAKRYRGELEQLDHYVRSRIGEVPVAERKVLTSHDALGYYGDAYGVKLLSPLGLSTESEASAADVAKLIGQIRQQGIKAYFFENSNDPRLVEQIAAATGARPSGALYVEALSTADGSAPDYLKMIRYDTDLMVAAMKGDVH